MVKILLTQPEYNDQQRRDYSDRFDCCRWEETVCDECGVILEEGHTGLCKKCKAAAHEELLAAGVMCDECGMELEGIGPGLCRECMHQRGCQGNIYYQGNATISCSADSAPDEFEEED